MLSEDVKKRILGVAENSDLNTQTVIVKRSGKNVIHHAHHRTGLSEVDRCSQEKRIVTKLIRDLQWKKRRTHIPWRGLIRIKACSLKSE